MNRREALQAAAAAAVPGAVETVEAKRPLAIKLTVAPCTLSHRDVQQQLGGLMADRFRGTELEGLPVIVCERGVTDVEIIEDPRE